MNWASWLADYLARAIPCPICGGVLLVDYIPQAPFAQARLLCRVLAEDPHFVVQMADLSPMPTEATA